MEKIDAWLTLDLPPCYKGGHENMIKAQDILEHEGWKVVLGANRGVTTMTLSKTIDKKSLNQMAEEIRDKIFCQAHKCMGVFVFDNT